MMHLLGSSLGFMNGFSEAMPPKRAPTGQSLLQKNRLSFRLKKMAIIGIIQSSMKIGLTTLVMYVVDLR
jgi:hypothetical protein